MRIAYVCSDPGVPVFGNKGCSIHCQAVIREFVRRGFEVDLFATRAGNNVLDDFQDVRFHRLSERLPKDIGERERALRDQNGRLARKLAAAGPFDLIYERYSLWSFSAMRFAKENGVPSLLEVNAPLIQEQKAYRKIGDVAAAKRASDICLSEADSIIAVSQEVGEQITLNGNGSKVSVVPNGVDVGRFDLGKSDGDGRNRKGEKTVIGFVGTLKPWHGVDKLLDAFALVNCGLPDVELHIIGDGPERERLEEQLDTYPVDVRPFVRWHGSVPNSEVPELMSRFSIAVAPYPQLDGFYFSPLKILEYMAAGIAVVASRIGQIPMLIDHDRTGVLVEPGNEFAMADALIGLIGDGKRRERLGVSAREQAVERHSWSRVVDQMLSTVALHPVGIG